jgi:Tfp pilus assembly protein PilF
MEIQRLLNFYDTCATTSASSNPVVHNQSFKSSLNEQVNSIDTFWKSNEYVTKKRAEFLKQTGNEHLKNNQYKKAISYYKRAIELKPDYADAYFNIAKAYTASGNVTNSIEAYKELLQISPNDVEALANVGEQLKETNQANEATKYYLKALDIDPRYDLASRSIKEIKYKTLAKTNPKAAEVLLNKQADENMQKALNIVMANAPEYLTDNLKNINFRFNKTSEMGGHANIAQYENDKKTITVTNNYIWAAPEIIAAYLVHEAVHAKDHDPYTSIQEEQDAYRESVVFWLANNNGVKDPEMDYAASLYLIDPAKLDAKVKEVYSTRDGSIPQYSPNHGLSAYGLETHSDLSTFSKIKNFFVHTLLKITHPFAQPQISSDQGLLYNTCR